MSEKSEKNAEKANALKITDQFRAGNGMVYDLKADGNRLTLCVFPRENPSEAGAWRIEARTSHAPEAVIVSEWGATRVEALSEVGRTWRSKAPMQGLPNFDWDAVAAVLTSVRAL